MKWVDVRNEITKKLTQKFNKSVQSENIDNLERDSFYIDLINYNKEYISEYRERKQIEIDILYYPKNFSKTANSDTYSILEEVDCCFEVRGKKILHIGDRFLLLKDVSIKIVDKVGHYSFTIDLYDEYGRVYDYELMQDLNLNFKGGKKWQMKLDK